MITATKECSFDAAHRLSFHKGKCFNLHGHTYKLQVTLCEDNLTNGMVRDFYDIKTLMNEIVENWDHATVLYKEDAINQKLMATLEECGMKYISFDVEPTVENMCKYFLEYFKSRGLGIHKIRMYETPTSFAEVTNE